MPSIRSIIRTGLISGAALLIAAMLPLVTYADSPSTTCTPPASSQAGVHHPTGSDAGTFTYQCTGQYAGEWTNQYYVYNPSTNARSPLYAPDYSYDCTTGKWTMTSWDYDAATGQYNDDRVTASAPAGATTDCPVTSSGSSTGGSSPASTTPPSGSNASPTPNNSSASGGTSTNLAANGVANPSGGSSNTTTSSNGTTYVNNGTTAVNTNTITGVATSGNAVVLGNTTGGDAASGDVQDEANIINMLQSTSNALGTGSNVITFTDNINGDVDGDLLLDPASLGVVQPASLNNNSTAATNNVTINNSTDATMNDNINLAAQSGDATVADNTAGGNAITGNAQAIADVVNMLNSAVSAGQSFIGVININGNLNGDILLPPDFVNQLLADNVPTVNVTVPGSSNTGDTNTSTNTTVNNTNKEGINNQVNSNSSSGQATVSGNTAAGGATSGQATTSVTAFNLTGSNVIGANDLLVFVNVLGNWVGMIMNAPAGATAAELGGGINSATTTAASNTNVNNNTDEQINNNITVGAQSGNATVSHNTKGGDATTGNASTAVNLLNVEGSTLSLSNWFGILFINVFGSWDGSFGVNTAAGDPPGATSATSVTPAEASVILSHNPVFGFVTHSAPASGSSTPNTDPAPTSTSTTSIPTATGTVLAAKTIKSSASGAPTPQLQGTSSSAWKTFSVIGGLVVLYIIGDAIVSHRRRIHET